MDGMNGSLGSIMGCQVQIKECGCLWVSIAMRKWAATPYLRRCEAADHVSGIGDLTFAHLEVRLEGPLLGIVVNLE
jgi:hypothetical protein